MRKRRTEIQEVMGERGELNLCVKYMSVCDCFKWESVGMVYVGMCVCL